MKARAVLTLFLLLCSSLRAWSQEPWHEQPPVHVGDGPPAVLLLSPDGRQLVVCARSRWRDVGGTPLWVANDAINVVDTGQWRVSKRLGAVGRYLLSAAFLPSGRLGVVYNDARGSQWCAEFDPTSWKPLPPRAVFTAADDRPGVYGAFTADGRLFAAHYGRMVGAAAPPPHFTGRTVIWATESWQPRAEFTRDLGGDTPFMFFAQDGRILEDSAFERGDRQDDLRFSTIEPNSRLSIPFYTVEPARLRGEVNLLGPLRACTLSPDGRTLVASHSNSAAGSLIFYDIAGGRRSEPLSHALDTSPRLSRERNFTALAFSEDGRMLAAGDSDGTIKTWETDTWTLTQELHATSTPHEVTALRFSPDGTLLIAGLANGTLRVFRR